MEWDGKFSLSESENAVLTMLMNSNILTNNNKSVELFFFTLFSLGGLLLVFLTFDLRSLLHSNKFSSCNVHPVWPRTRESTTTTVCPWNFPLRNTKTTSTYNLLFAIRPLSNFSIYWERFFLFSSHLQFAVYNIPLG